MKRITWFLPILVLVLLYIPEAKAQELGVTGGLNMANLSGKTYSTTKDGLVIGGFARYNLIAGLSLEPEVLFSMKGATGTVTPLGPTPVNVRETSTLTMDYVEVPILLRMNLLSLPILPAGIDIFAGPDFAFKVYSDSKNTIYLSNSTQVRSGSMSGELRNFDFNIAVGGGPNITIGPMTLGLELRYTFATGRAFHSESSNWNNNVWSIMASASF